MENVLAEKATSLSEIKSGPSNVIKELEGGAAAIFNRNEISAYLVSKERFKDLNEKELQVEGLSERIEELEELLFDLQMKPVIEERLQEGRKKVTVSLDEL